MKRTRTILLIVTIITALMLCHQTSSAEMREMADYEMEAIVGGISFTFDSNTNSGVERILQTLYNNIGTLDKPTARVMVTRLLNANNTGNSAAIIRAAAKLIVDLFY